MTAPSKDIRLNGINININIHYYFILKCLHIHPKRRQSDIAPFREIGWLI